MTRRCWCLRPVAKDIPDSLYCGNHDNPPPVNVRRFMDMEKYDPSDDTTHHKPTLADI